MYVCICLFLILSVSQIGEVWLKISVETQLSLEETFETIAGECSGRLIPTPDHSLKRISLIEGDILSNPRQIQMYLT